MNPLLAHLNAPQLAAVTLPPAHALILAGAGSGKTRVLTTRIAWLISTGQVSPSGILAVTFTNKAAKEMQARLAGMLPINVKGMWIGTFHGLCNRLLRAHYRDAGLPQLFQILDSADQQSAVKRLLKSLNVDDEKFPPRELCHFINAQKEQGLRAAAVEAWDDWARKRVGFYEAYEAQCQREGVVDFAELLLRSYELLERNEPLRRHYQERFRHVLVDEFQDTNKLQYRWLCLLAGREQKSRDSMVSNPPAPRPALHSGPAPTAQDIVLRNPVSAPLSGKGGAPAPPAGEAVRYPPAPLSGKGGDYSEVPKGACIFAVGDDDQSIYAFRGADVGNMADFEREFKVQNLIRLEQNYRSHGNILDAANAIIKNNPQRLGKNLWTEAGSGEPIRIHESCSEGDEARWIVEEVKALVRDGHARAEIALLYRSNAQSRALEHALFNAGLPYRVYGGLRFFERAEVKHALAYLRLIANADDDTAFARVVNFPARGIGARSLESLQDAAKLANSSLHAAIPRVVGKGGASLAGFAQLIVKLREAANLPLPELVDHVVELSGLRSHYQNEKEGQERLANLDELINAAASFVAEEGVPDQDGEITGELGSDLSSFSSGVTPSALAFTETVPPMLASFLSHASLEAGEHQAGEGDDALQLMTVHSAKGLEFNVVFISGLEDGLFPHENSMTETRDGKSGLEEERRLMYVAVTRARQRIYFSFAQTRMLHGQTRYNLPSRFLDEVPEDLVKWLTPRVGALHAGDGASRTGNVGFAMSEAGSRSHGAAAGASFGGTPRRSELPGGSGFRIGQTVMHPKFGLGVIINAEGSGTDARVQVNFGVAGIKWLALSIAKLEAA